MLSLESQSYDLTLEQLRVSNPNVRVAVHFLLPDLDVPLHLRGLTRRGEEHNFPLNARLYGVLTAMDVMKKKMHRLLFVPEFNSMQTHYIGDTSVETLLHTKQQYQQPYYGVPNCFDALQQYITASLQVLKDIPTADPRLVRIHSVFWSFDLSMHNSTMKLYVPYVCLVCRGDVLVNHISKHRWKSIQSFFIRELMNSCKESGLMPSEFMKLSFDAVLQPGNQHKVFLHLANMFSLLVHRHIKYMTDYKATGETDAIGISNFDGMLYADCEDMAQAAYDLIRVCRKVFPSSITDLHNGATSFAYHVSAWLNDAKLGIMQGAIGKSYDRKLHNHIWCCILPKRSQAVFVEGTLGHFKPSEYQYIVRFWQRGHDKMRDYVLLSPDRAYGMACNQFLQEQRPIDFIEENSHKCNASSLKKELHFAANLQIDTFNILNYLIKTN